MRMKSRSYSAKHATSPSIKGLGNATASLQEQNELLIGMLETLSESRRMNEYLKQLVRYLKKHSGCRCVGISLLGDEGNITYKSYDGFSRDFYMSESPHRSS
jgi:transcriptional regulator with GAF, ATPase, and Fis domain